MAVSTIEINSSGFTGYLSTPEADKAPGIILIQEAFGVNSHIKDVADLYAAAGYTVLAPDLFWRTQPGIQLGYTPEEMPKGIALAKGVDEKQTLADLKAALEKLRSLPQCKRKVGTVGFCMGGSYAYLLAVNDLVDAAVGYYGSNIVNHLAEAKNLHCPLMLHFGAKDKNIPLIGAVDKIKEALANKGHVEIYVYDAGHGFNCDQRASYDRRAAMLAFARSFMFLNKAMS